MCEGQEVKAARQSKHAAIQNEIDQFRRSIRRLEALHQEVNGNYEGRGKEPNTAEVYPTKPLAVFLDESCGELNQMRERLDKAIEALRESLF